MEKKKLYIETYGCQMNFSDSEIVASIMQDEGYEVCEEISDADTIFVNTCSIRDHAEQRVKNRLKELHSMKNKRPDLTIGLLGCMAERLKEELLQGEDAVDLIAGPDAYRDLPQLMSITEAGQKAANVILSEEETYADLKPIRYDTNGVSAFISIMRGCQNFCTYCVVPYTRGKERSRSPKTILEETHRLFGKGYKEVTLLGQNVNSYYYNEDGTEVSFAELIKMVAEVNPDLRVRFATSHPKDISDELIKTIADHSNICNHIHLPVQSGSSDVLKKMNRKYDREWYLNRIKAIKEFIPNCGLSTDIIAGFCGETEDDHKQTMSMMNEVGYDFSFMFKYSERPGTAAAKRFDDDVPEDIKKRRLEEIIKLQQDLSLESNKSDIGKTFRVLADSISKKSDVHLSGRNEQNKVIVFPKADFKVGDYVEVKVNDCTSATLMGEAI